MKFWNFRYFRGHFCHSQKSPKISTDTYRTKLFLCELNAVGDSLQLEYLFQIQPYGSFYEHQIIKNWQNLEKTQHRSFMRVENDKKQFKNVQHPRKAYESSCSG